MAHQDKQEQPVLDFAASSNDEIPISVSAEETQNDKIAARELGPSPSAFDGKASEKDWGATVHAANQDYSGLENDLEARKKRLLEELESVLLPKDEFSAAEKTHGCKIAQQDFPARPSLGIEVIDETALVETVPASLGTAKKPNFHVPKKSNEKDANANANANVNKETNIKSGKQSRRKAKAAKMDGKHRSVPARDEEAQNGGNGTKRKYSRKEMEVLRFVDMAEQRKIWKAIYGGLGDAVAKEYDNLAGSEHQKHIRVNYDPPQSLAKKKGAPAILSVGAANGRWRYVNVFVH